MIRYLETIRAKLKSANLEHVVPIVPVPMESYFFFIVVMLRSSEDSGLVHEDRMYAKEMYDCLTSGLSAVLAARFGSVEECSAWLEEHFPMHQN